MRNLLNKISSFIFLNGESSAERTEADILVSHLKDTLANIKVRTVKSSEVITYRLEIDGETIKEMKYTRDWENDGRADELICVVKHKIQKKEPYLSSEDFNPDDLYQTIKNEYKPLKTL